MFFRIVVVFLVVFSMGCKSTATPSEIKTLKTAVANKNFEANFNFATPVALANVRGLENILPPGSNTANISLLNIPNHFTVKNDSLKIDIPYYGEQQIALAFKSDNGIKYMGKVGKMKARFNAKKNKYILEYWIDAKDENLRATLTLFANYKSSMSLNSSHRTTINYNGTWKVLK
jgi:hypothetical protein